MADKQDTPPPEVPLGTGDVDRSGTREKRWQWQHVKHMGAVEGLRRQAGALAAKRMEELDDYRQNGPHRHIEQWPAGFSEAVGVFDGNELDSMLRLSHGMTALARVLAIDHDAVMWNRLEPAAEGEAFERELRTDDQAALLGLLIVSGEHLTALLQKPIDDAPRLAREMADASLVAGTGSK